MPNKALDSINEQEQVDFASMDEKSRSNLGATLGGGIGFEASGPAGSVIGAAIGAQLANSTRALREGEVELNTRKQNAVGFLNNIGIKDIDTEAELANLAVNPLDGRSTRKADELDPTNPLSSIAEEISLPIASLIGRGNLGFVNSEGDLDSKSLKSINGILSNFLIDGSKDVGSVVSKARGIIDSLKTDRNGVNAHLSTTSLPKEDRDKMNAGMKLLFDE